ncbi:MAG: DUF3820 family protein [Verrucomicrobiota bacterium]
MNDSEWDDWRKNLAETLQAFATTRMPFGKYGPQHYPPQGLPIHQLPAEYLMWFRQQGFPKGKLGRLLEALCEIHRTGAEAILAPLRGPDSHPHPLRKTRRKSFDFGGDPE